MRNYKKTISLALILLLISFSIFYFYPRKMNREYDAIMYRLGDTDYSENIKVKINGYYSRGLLKGDKYKGTITIDNNILSKIDVRFDDFNRTVLLYYDESTRDYTFYGDMFSNNMDEFTICIFEKNEQNIRGKTWSSVDGLMISAPASSRAEALEVSIKLMKDISTELK